MYPEKRSRTQNLPPVWLRQDDNLGWCEASKEVGPRSNFARTPRSACSWRSRVAPFASHTSAFAPFREPLAEGTVASLTAARVRSLVRGKRSSKSPRVTRTAIGATRTKPWRPLPARSRAESSRCVWTTRAARSGTHAWARSTGPPMGALRNTRARFVSSTPASLGEPTTHPKRKRRAAKLARSKRVFFAFFPRARAHAAFSLPPFLPVRYRRSRAGDPALAFRARDRDLRAAAGG